MKDMEEQVLPVSEIRSRAVTGSTVVVLRGVVVRLISFAGSLILARMLTPSDFGLVAVGFTLVAFASFLADGGLGAALIRRPEAPTRLELESLLGFQIALTLIMVGITAAVAPIFGRAGIVTLVMVAALPIVTLQAPGSILLERRLRYERRVLVELTESVAYTGTAIVAVALGAGVWGLAGATIARAVVGAVAMNVVTPVRVLRPRLRFRDVRQLLGFGARYQAVGVVNLLRDQGLNLGVAAIGGLSALGLWNVAYRVMQVPFVVFEALWRVSFPAMARLIALGQDARPAVRQILRVATVANGFVLVGLAGASPFLLGTLFGEPWQAASAVLAPACAGMLLSGPVSVAAAGYLYAIGDSRTMLRAVLLHTIAWLGLALPLLPVLGVAAIGYGWLASGVVEALVLGHALHKVSGVGTIPIVWRSTLTALVAAAGGMLLATSLPAGLFGAVAGGTLAEVLFLLGVLVLDRAPLRRLLSLARQGGQGMVTGSK